MMELNLEFYFSSEFHFVIRNTKLSFFLIIKHFCKRLYDVNTLLSIILIFIYTLKHITRLVAPWNKDARPWAQTKDKICWVMKHDLWFKTRWWYLVYFNSRIGIKWYIQNRVDIFSIHQILTSGCELTSGLVQHTGIILLIISGLLIFKKSDKCWMNGLRGSPKYFWWSQITDESVILLKLYKTLYI